MVFAISETETFLQPSQATRDPNDPLQLQQDSVLESHTRNRLNPGKKGYSSDYIDSLLAKEFTSLTVQERSKTYEEIHGVSDCIDETPAFVENCLLQLDEELSRITEKSAYEIAEQQNKAYVTDEKFRLMFLRATFFHPQKAGVKLVAFFEGKLHYFGQETLTRQLQLSDLGHNEGAFLKAGHVQVLPARDRSGRPIRVYYECESPIDQSFKAALPLLRVFIFQWLMMAEDEENQKRGVVTVTLLMGNSDISKADTEVMREFSRLENWLPLRTAAVHLCTDNVLAGFLLRTAAMGLPRDARLRLKLHFGTFTEITYSLMGYGIPVDVFPFTGHGIIKKTNLNRWISKYNAREHKLKKTSTFDGIDLPSRNDVLIASGKPFQQHPGNVHLRNLEESYMKEFMGTRLERALAIDKVYEAVKARSGRFLRHHDDGWWREISEEDAKDKVRSTFRTMKTKQNDEMHRSSSVVASQDIVNSETLLFLPHGKKPRYGSDSCCDCSS